MDQFYDIYNVWHLPWWQHSFVKIGLGVLLVLLIATVIMQVIKKNMRKIKSIPAWQEALRDFDRLGSSDMLNEYKAKIFYTRLTVVIKQYIHKRYGFDIEGKTDREILAFLDEQIVFPRDLIAVLQDILDHAGSIKFANCAGLLEQMQRDLALSVRLVKESMPQQST
jgi:hypothetical protein